MQSPYLIINSFTVILVKPAVKGIAALVVQRIQHAVVLDCMD